MHYSNGLAGCGGHVRALLSVSLGHFFLLFFFSSANENTLQQTFIKQRFSPPCPSR